MHDVLAKPDVRADMDAGKTQMEQENPMATTFLILSALAAVLVLSACAMAHQTKP